MSLYLVGIHVPKDFQTEFKIWNDVFKIFGFFGRGVEADFDLILSKHRLHLFFRKRSFTPAKQGSLADAERAGGVFGQLPEIKLFCPFCVGTGITFAVCALSDFDLPVAKRALT